MYICSITRNRKISIYLCVLLNYSL